MSPNTNLPLRIRQVRRAPGGSAFPYGPDAVRIPSSTTVEPGIEQPPPGSASETGGRFHTTQFRDGETRTHNQLMAILMRCSFPSYLMGSFLSKNLASFPSIWFDAGWSGRLVERSSQ